MVSIFVNYCPETMFALSLSRSLVRSNDIPVKVKVRCRVQDRQYYGLSETLLLRLVGVARAEWAVSIKDRCERKHLFGSHACVTGPDTQWKLIHVTSSLNKPQLLPCNFTNTSNCARVQKMLSDFTGKHARKHTHT